MRLKTNFELIPDVVNTSLISLINIKVNPEKVTTNGTRSGHSSGMLFAED